jgi:Tol biopolymer transport system component
VPASAYWIVASWFPDGTQLLADADEPGGRMSIWTVSVLGQSPRQLREGALWCAVSPDGTRIAFNPVVSTDNAREVWVMGSQGDNPQKVFAVGENEMLGAGVHGSPDGQRLAYIRIKRISDRDQMSIETCDLKGASRTVVVPASELELADFCWLPEGRIVYARLEPLDSSEGNLWQIGIDNHAGTPTGKPKRITQWAGSSLRS